MRILLAIACIAALSGANAGERVQFAGGAMSIEAPDGWRTDGTSPDERYVHWFLCQEAYAESCAVRAEFTVDIKSESLEDVLAGWERFKMDIVVPARRLQVRGDEAVELVTRGRHSDHIEKQVYFDVLVVRKGDASFKCALTTDPADYMALQGVLQTVCASIQSTPSTSNRDG